VSMYASLDHNPASRSNRAEKPEDTSSCSFLCKEMYSILLSLQSANIVDAIPLPVGMPQFGCASDSPVALPLQGET
jgi:hypothetical protein